MFPFKYLDQESNLDLNLRRVPCDPLHHRDMQYPDLESNQDPDLRRVLCDPLHHRDVTCRADDWTCTSIIRFTGPAPCCSSHVGSWAPGPQAGSTVFDQDSSFTFQYASLMNFDQLSIRTWWSA